MRLLRSLLHWLIGSFPLVVEMTGNGGEKMPLRACPPSKCVSKARAKASIAKSRKSLSLLPSRRLLIQSAPVHSRRIATKPSNETNPSTNLHPLCLRQLFPTLIEFILCLGKSSGAPTGRPILFCPNNISLPSPFRTHRTSFPVASSISTPD